MLSAYEQNLRGKLLFEVIEGLQSAGSHLTNPGALLIAHRNPVRDFG